ncbi:MAG: LLM class flavin-dependent oxidoreductase [Acidimicrobiia bacterium]|nr:LLM class flavin-dependent oxidoreductase [Acidimicrobiia bacterium]
MTFPWGIWFEPTQPVRRIVELARLAEAEGATVCLIADEGTARDVYVTMTAVLMETQNLTVGPGITNPFSRHPVTTAATIATLHEAFPNRVWHGLGVGGSRVLEPLALDPKKPYTALKEAVDINTRLLAGEMVGTAQLDWFEGEVPLALAGRGPRTQNLAAERADWVVLTAKPLADLPEEAERIRAGGNAKIAWSAYLAYSEEEKRQVLAHFSYMAVDSPPDIRAAAGLDDERVEKVRSAMLAGDFEAAVDLLPLALVDSYAVAGTPEQCAETIRSLRSCFDLFMLPINKDATAEDHIRASAPVLRAAASE